MVVVTNIPDSRHPEVLKQTEHISCAIAETHLELYRDVVSKASEIEKVHEIACKHRTEVPKGLHHCKELIKIAVRDKEPVLLQKCCEFMISKLSTANVLEVYSFLMELAPDNDDQPIPSAPPVCETDCYPWEMLSNETLFNVKKECNQIINACAYEVFLYPSQVAMLSYNDFQAILRRDELCAPQEELLYNAMYDWGKCRCSDGNTEYLQKVLRDLPKLIRYGLMKPKIFKKLKDVKDLLDEKDWRIIRFHVEERAKGRDAYNLPYRWSKPRASPPDGTQIQVGRKRNLEQFVVQCLMCWMVIFD